MGYAIINPLACVSFGGNKSGKKSAVKKPEPAPAPVSTTIEAADGDQNAAAALTVGPKQAADTKSVKKSAAKKPEPAPAPVATATEATEGNKDAEASTSTAGPKRAAAGKRRKAEAAYRGGFLPYRPLWSYNIDPVANCMPFYAGVGQILC
jgi:hypothetical protein